MAKRFGPNSRKKTARRKRTVTVLLFRAAAALLIVFLALAGSVLLYRKCEPRIMGLVSQINASRNPVVNHVVIKGALPVLPDELLRRAGVLLPLSLDSLKKECFTRIAGAHPWIEQVRLVHNRGGTATIEVRQRRPIALLQCATIRLVDDQGVCMPPEKGVAYEVPLVSGLADSAGRLPGDGLRRLTRFLSEAGQFDSAFAGSVSQLHFGRDGRVTIILAGTPTVVVMQDSAVREGLVRLARVWAMVGSGRHPQRIDLSYTNLAFVTPHGGTRIAGTGGPKGPGTNG